MTHYQQIQLILSSRNPFLSYIQLWKRYIDDIFLIWTGPLTELTAFHSFLNDSSNSLKFTIASDRCQMSFLDILVIKENNRLNTDLYRKPTDRNALLHGESYHPTPLKKGIPVGQFKRIRRICSVDQSFTTHAIDLADRFKQRGYPDEWIKPATDKFMGQTQVECLKTKEKTEKDKQINCYVQYSPLGKEFEATIRKHWHVLSSDPTLGRSFSAPPHIVYKRPPNLRNLLVRSHLRQDTPAHFLSDIPDGNYKCGRCAQCNFTSKCHTFSHPTTGKSFKIKGIISCTTNNVVYMIKCVCGLAYVGKTLRPLKTRISEHRSDIRNKNFKNPVALHFHQAQHCISSLRYLGIERVKLPPRGGDIDTLLLQREAFWISTLNTVAKGLNESFDIRPFL